MFQISSGYSVYLWQCRMLLSGRSVLLGSWCCDKHISVFNQPHCIRTNQMISEELIIGLLLIKVWIWQTKNMYLHYDLKSRYNFQECHRSWIQGKRNDCVECARYKSKCCIPKEITYLSNTVPCLSVLQYLKLRCLWMCSQYLRHTLLFEYLTLFMHLNNSCMQCWFFLFFFFLLHWMRW